MPYSLSVPGIRKAPTNFPYTDPTTRFFVVEDGAPVPITVNRRTVKNLRDFDPQIYAVWPGRVRSSDMFLIDKLELVKAFL